MANIFSLNSRYMRWLHDALLSSYCSLLFVSIEESRPFAWSTKGSAVYFWHPHAVSLSRSDLFLFYIELFLIPSLAILAALQLIRLVSLSGTILRVIGGLIAVVGFPLVCLYRNGPPLLFLEVALVIAALSFVLWTYGKWPLSVPLNVTLLILYYSLWSFFGGGARLTNRPTAEWGVWDYAWFVYPLLGFAYTVGWATYFGQLGENEGPNRLAAA